jgi:predicted transcriptional regulator
MSNQNAAEVSQPRPSVWHNPIPKFMFMRQSLDPDFCLAPAQQCKPIMRDGRRSRIDIVFDVLDIVGEDGEIGPTRLIGRANISWNVLKETMTYLTERAILTTRTVGAREFVSLSPIGFRLLETLKVAQSLLMPDEDDPRGSLGTDDGVHHLEVGIPSSCHA